MQSFLSINSEKEREGKHQGYSFQIRCLQLLVGNILNIVYCIVFFPLIKILALLLFFVLSVNMDNVELALILSAYAFMI